MKLLKLTLNKFLSYDEQDINFEVLNGVVFFVGKIENDSAKSNGSGKSAIFDAISWALFGTSRTSSDDELIKIGEKQASVTLVFSLDGKEYSIVRIKKLGKSQTVAFVCVTDGLQLTGNSVKETQAKIIDVLGLDSELFENTVFARQGRIDEFPRQNPSRRKEMLRDILKIDQYEKWENDAKEMARTYDTQVQSLTSAMQTLTNRISLITVTQDSLDRQRLTVNAIQAKIKQVATDKGAKTDACAQLRSVKQLLDRETENNDKLAGDISRIDMQMEYIDKNAQGEIDKIIKSKQDDVALVTKEESVNSILAEIEAKIKALEGARTQYELMMQNGAQLETEIRRIAGTLKESDVELDKLRKKLDTFDELGDKCPLCQSTITEQQHQVVRDEIIAEGLEKKERRDNLEAEKVKAEATLKQLKEEIKKVDAGFGKSRELDLDKQKYERELINIQTAKNRIEFAEVKVTETKNMFVKQKLELKFEVQRKRVDLEKSFAAIESYKLQLADLDKMEAELTSLADMIATYQREERQCADELSKMEYELADRKKNEDELKMAKLKADKAQSDLFVYTELTKAFGKNGIPLLIVENALAELQAEVMAQLNTLTDGSITVEFRTQKELKSGKMADSLDIVVADRSGSRDFNLYSGGEKMRIALAIRLGLAKLLSRRAGKRFEMLIIDEVSDLDSHGMQKFVDLIGLVAKDYKQIFVVSHINELKDSFGQVVTIVKDKEGSRVTL